MTYLAHPMLPADGAAPPSAPAGGALAEAAAGSWLPSTCFKTGPPGRLGCEVELLVVDREHPAEPVPAATGAALHEHLHALPLSGRVTREPGGQIELSSVPWPHASAAVGATVRDLTTLHTAAAQRGLALVGIGADPVRPAGQVLQEPRYRTMADYLRRTGPPAAAATMMCRSASVQVNVEALDPSSGDPWWRWQALHDVGPALVAAFATSPLDGGRRSGRASGRMAAWLDLDPTRTRPALPLAGEDPGTAWTGYVLDAPLLLVRRAGGDWSAPPGVTFRRWLREGAAVVPGRGAPRTDDLAYHLTTLFPPVRPRGFLEVRYLDAQPGPWWAVPVAVIAALTGCRSVAEQAGRQCSAARGHWRAAAEHGLRHEALADAADTVLAIAAEALEADDCHAGPASRQLARLVDLYRRRWTAQGRSPGDDLSPTHPWPATGSAADAEAEHLLTTIASGHEEDRWAHHTEEDR